MNDERFPPSFVVGQQYFDRIGEYTVVAIDRDHLTIERPNGYRAVQDIVAKARIHQAVLNERNANVSTVYVRRTRERRQPTGRRRELMNRILQLEADGENHAGVEIDRYLVGAACEFGYSAEDLSSANSPTGRSVFGNDGDWAKAKLTEDRLHEVVGRAMHWDGGSRRACNVYRITALGLDELRRLSLR